MSEDIISSRTSASDPCNTLVLVATDDQTLLRDLSRALREAGFRTVEMPDGKTALNACMNAPPSLAILDCDMAPPNGIEVAESILHAERFPVIIVSARCDDALVQKASDTGAMAYLMKSTDLAHAAVPAVKTALRRFAEIKNLNAEAEKLEFSMQKIRFTSVAVGILMEKFHLSEKDAYDRLRQFSRNQSSKITDVAHDLSARLNELNVIFSRIGLI